MELKIINKVTNYLNELNLTSRRGNKFCHTTVEHILRNEFYVGKIHWGETVVAGSHKPIINKISFGKVQSLLKKRMKVTS